MPTKKSKSAAAANGLSPRQIHLDFHTGPRIPDVGADFDPAAFARTMKKAHVTSVTVFAKCHHGHLYYQTDHPARHPSLPKDLDLTRDQIEALHAEGIRAPIYISVQCDEWAANQHPEWVARGVDGSAVGAKPLQPGWQILDMSSPYQEYLAQQVAEILEKFSPVDGIFFDMCWDQPSLSIYAKAKMLAEGLDPASEADRQRYAHAVAKAYMKRFYRAVRKASPQATVYFNSRPLSYLPEDIAYLSHVEIEALPTGGWGYMYFPKNVRYVRTFGKPYLGMTSRFHKSWGDFGGLKPYAALFYEVCQMLAHGAACSIGDQLHPRGRLDEAAYDLIGRVYAYAESCEPWTQEATPVTQIGLFRAGAAGTYHDTAGGLTNDGATRMLTQLKHQFDIVEPLSDFSHYDLLILPDSIAVSAALAKKLRTFVQKAGALLLSGTSGLDASLKPLLPEMGIEIFGWSPFTTTYLRFGKQVAQAVPPTDHVLYERGLRARASKTAQTLVEAVEPYFERSYQHFCSHYQTPPQPEASGYAAAVRKGKIIYISFPVFQAFGQYGNIPYRQLVENCINLLLHRRLVTIAAPSTAEVTVMRQGKRVIAHVLSFCAERRKDLDIIEDIVPLYDMPLTIRLGHAPRHVYLAPSRQALSFDYHDGRVSVVIPRVDGHQMVVFE